MRTLRLVAINLALTLVLLLAVEGCVRLVYPEIRPLGTEGELAAPNRYGSIPGLKPKAHGLSDGIPVSVDERGFWHYPSAARSDATAYPGWLFLGDSVTMGIGVALDSTFAGRLAARLDTAVVLNPSLVGYQATDYVAIAEALLDRADARVQRIAVFWCLNDAYDPRQWEAQTGPTVRARSGFAFDFLRRHVRTFQWAKATFADRPLVYFRHDRQFYTSDSTFAAAQASLARLARLAAEHGVRLDIVALPYEVQLRGDVAGAWEPQRRLREAAEAQGLAFYDAAEAFAGHEPASLYRYGDGIHFSDRGHALLARYLLERL